MVIKAGLGHAHCASEAGGSQILDQVNGHLETGPRMQQPKHIFGSGSMVVIGPCL